MALNKKSLKSASSKSETTNSVTNAPATRSSETAEYMLKSDFTQLQTVLQTLVSTLTSLTGRVEKLESDSTDLAKRVEELADQLDAALSDSDDEDESGDESDEEFDEESDEEETEDDEEDVTADDLDVDKVLNIIKGMSGDEQKKVWLSARKRSGVSNLNPQVLKRKPECVLQLAEALNEEFDIDAEDMLKD